MYGFASKKIGSVLLVTIIFSLIFKSNGEKGESDEDEVDNDFGHVNNHSDDDSARLQRMLERTRPEKNKHLILREMYKHLKNDSDLLFLELLSGTGQFISFLAKNTPLTFQPSETNQSLMDSILSYKSKFKLKNILEPINLDPCSDPDTWFPNQKVENFSIDYMFNANTILVRHFNCTKEIFRGAHRYLKSGGLLFLYGPFAYGTVRSPECNENLDKMLKKHNVDWGFRDAYRELSSEAALYDYYLDRTHFYPAPHYTELLVWRRKHDKLSQRAEFIYQKNIKQR